MCTYFRRKFNIFDDILFVCNILIIIHFFVAMNIYFRCWNLLFKLLYSIMESLSTFEIDMFFFCLNRQFDRVVYRDRFHFHFLFFCNYCFKVIDCNLMSLYTDILFFITLFRAKALKSIWTTFIRIAIVSTKYHTIATCIFWWVSSHCGCSYYLFSRYFFFLKDKEKINWNYI